MKTGLFSSIVSTFLSLSLPDLRNGTAALTPFVVVNVFWLLSLVLSLSSALYATLFQQWSRRYLELSQRRVAPHKRARIREYMFSSISTFKMTLAVKVMPVLLHLSIFFFFAGLVLYVWNTHATAGYFIFGFILVFAFCYIALTLLPHLYLNSPFSTPFSEFAWRTSQRFILATFSLINLLLGLSSSILALVSALIYQPTQEPSQWAQWRGAVRTRIKERRKWLKLGLQDSIMLNATEAPSTTDEIALSWTLTNLEDEREFEDFVARVPRFLESALSADASSVMLSLMDVQASQSNQFDPVLGSRINDLLKTCIPGTSPLTDELRRNRLRVCLRTLWYFAREYNRRRNTTPLPTYVRLVFANPEMTHRIQFEVDLAARLIGRSFCSLIVKKLEQDIGSRTAQGHPPSVAELSCLAAILGKTSAEVVTLLSQPGAIGLANIVSLTSSEMDTLISQGVPSELQDMCQMTLDILLVDLLPTLPNAKLPPDLAANFHETYSNAQRLQAPNWLIARLRQIWEVLPVVHDDKPEVVAMLAIPEPEPWF